MHGGIITTKEAHMNYENLSPEQQLARAVRRSHELLHRYHLLGLRVNHTVLLVRDIVQARSRTS